MPPIPEWRADFLLRPDISPEQKPLIHDLCQEELDGLFKDTLERKVLKNQTAKRMRYFYEHPQDFAKFEPFFEYIGKISDGKEEIPYYSIRYNHVKELGNLRILFILLNGSPFLIHAFQETRGSAYENAKAVIKARLKEEPPQ